MRAISKIIVHHSASQKTTTPMTITAWHKERGFLTIGYHAVIYKTFDGTWTIAKGRPEAQIGAHCEKHNTGTLGICVCGNYENEQMEVPALEMLIDKLTEWCKAYSIKPTEIYGHRDMKSTACPGKNLYDSLIYVRGKVAENV